MLLKKYISDVLLLTLISVFFTVADSWADEVTTRVYLTRDVIKQKPSTVPSAQFDCSDRIYAVVEITGFAPGQHLLQVSWIDPYDQQRELTRLTFQTAPSLRIWAWLQLHGPSGAVFGQLINPSYGMEEFIGDWQARVSIDGKQIELLSFNVLC